MGVSEMSPTMCVRLCLLADTCPAWPGLALMPQAGWSGKSSTCAPPGTQRLQRDNSIQNKCECASLLPPRFCARRRMAPIGIRRGALFTVLSRPRTLLLRVREYYGEVAGY